VEAEKIVLTEIGKRIVATRGWGRWRGGENIVNGCRGALG
jgi:hypothetical protein